MSLPNYAGLLEVKHFTSEEPVNVFGSDRPVKTLTEIFIYKAIKGKSEGLPFQKGKLLAKVRMSDFQFGMALARSNQTGNYCTLEYVHGFSVDKDSFMQTIVNRRMYYAMKDAASNDDQLMQAVSALEAIASNLQSGSKLTKKDREEWMSGCRVISENTVSNYRFAMNKLSAAAKINAESAKAEIHGLVRNYYRTEILKSLPSPEFSDAEEGWNSLLSEANILISPNRSSSHPLFDGAGFSNHSVSITLQGSDGQRKSAFSGEMSTGYSYDIEGKFIEAISVSVTPEQFSRFVRADSTLIPCTLNRVKDLEIDDERKSAQNTEKERLESIGDAIYSDVIGIAKAGMELVSATGGRTIKSRKEMIELTRQLRKALDLTSGTVKKTAHNFGEQEFSRLQKEVDEYVGMEAASLPDSVKDKILPLFSKK